MNATRASLAHIHFYESYKIIIGAITLSKPDMTVRILLHVPEIMT